MNCWRKYFFLFINFLFFSGCIVTDSELLVLREEMGLLRKEMEILKKNQADINIKMDTLNTNLVFYTEKLEENKYKMSILSQRMDDIHSSITQRMDILSKQLPQVDISLLPLPTELFQVAYNDYSRGMYDLAIRGFKDYLDKYPDSELAPKAYYYLADSYFAKKQYNESIEVIDAYIKKYGEREEFMPTMLYKKYQCYENLSLPTKAKEVQDYILNNYPNSREAQNIKSVQ